MTRTHISYCVLAMTVSILSAAQEYGQDHQVSTLRAPDTSMIGNPSISGHGERFDITITYPLFHAGESVDVDIFVAEWETNLPVNDARIELTMTGPGLQKLIPVEPTDEFGRYRARIENIGADAYGFLADIEYDNDFDLVTMSGMTNAEHDEPDAPLEHAFSLLDYGLYLLAAVAVVAAFIGFSLGVVVRGDRATTPDSGELT